MLLSIFDFGQHFTNFEPKFFNDNFNANHYLYNVAFDKKNIARCYQNVISEWCLYDCDGFYITYVVHYLRSQPVGCLLIFAAVVRSAGATSQCRRKIRTNSAQTNPTLSLLLLKSQKRVYNLLEN